MVKTKLIDKYEPNWQFTRIFLKKIKNIDEKFEVLNIFLKTYPTLEAHGRAYNWVKGLQKGYKNYSDINVYKCNNFLYSLEKKIEGGLINEKPLSTKNKNWYKDEFKKRTPSERLELWKNLFMYEKKFTQTGYRHFTLEQFVNNLFEVMQELGETSFVKNLTFDKILSFREKALNFTSNKKSFFF